MKDFNVKVNFSTAGAEKAAAGAQHVSGALQSVDASAQSMMRSVLSMAAQLAAPLTFGAMVKTGIEFNKTMEDTKVGIAGVLGVYRQYVDEQGRVAQGQDSFNAALVESEALQKQLAMAALATTASYTDMVEAFQVGVGPMLQGGVAMENTIALTQRLTQAMGALGIPMYQLGIEMRQFMRGDQLRSALMQRLGITKQMIDEWKKAGTLFENVMERTKSIGLASEAAAKTFTGGLSNLKDAFEQFMGKAFTGLYEKAKQTVFDLQKLFVDIQPAEGGGFTAKFNEDLLEVLAIVSEVMVTIVEIVKETATSVFESLTAGVQSSGGSWKEFFQVVGLGLSGLVEGIGYVAKFIGEAFSSPWETAKTVFKSAFGVILGGADQLVHAVAELLKPLAAIDERLYAPIKEAADNAHAVVDRFMLDLEKRLPDAVEKPFEQTKKLFEQFAFGEGKTDDLRKKLEGLLKGLGNTGDEAEETEKRFRALMKASDAYAKSLEQMRAQAERGMPDLFETIGLGDEAGAMKIEAQFESLQKVISDWAFTTGQRMDDVWERLKQWRIEALDALTSPFKKALPVAKSYMSVVGAEVRKSISQLRQEAGDLSQRLIEGGEGVRAAWVAIFANIATEAESLYRQTMDTWANMGRAFDEGFYAIFSGRVEDLKDVWKGFLDSMVRSFSQSVTDMVQKGIGALAQLAAGSNGDIRALPGTLEYNYETGQWEKVQNPEQYGAGASALGGLGTGFGAGAAAYGMYSSFGGKNSTIGTFSGVVGGVSALALGTTLGSAAGPIGAIIGAIIGLILQSLVSKDNVLRIGEYKLPYGTGQYGLPGDVGTQPGGGGGPRGGGGDIPVGGPGGRGPQDPFDPDTPIRQIQQDLKIPLRETMESWVSQFAELFEVADPTLRATFTQEMAAAMKTYMDAFDVRLAAGNEDDLRQVYEQFFSKFLPNQYLALGFGREAALPETSGIQEFFHGEDAAKDAAGKLWDPNAPIPRMLAGLGVTAQRIEEIAGMVGVEDPTILMQYLRDLVGVLVEFKSLSTEMAKTREQLFADIESEASKSPADYFRENAADLAGRLNELALYTGDEQMAQAQEVLALVRERWEAEKRYIAQIKGLIDQLTASIEAQQTAMDEFFLTPSEQIEKLRRKIFGTTDYGPTVTYDWQAKLYEANTPEEVQRIAQEMQQAIGQLFQALAAQVQAGKALMGDIDDLLAGNWSGVAQRDRTTIEGYQQDFEDLQTKLATAATLSGMEQIEAIRDVQAAAQEMYQRQLQLIATIDSNIAALHKSIEAQKFGILYQDMNPQEKANALAERIQSLRSQLDTATSPEQVQALTNEIQQLVAEYLGLFAADDPRRAEAKQWALDLLDDIESIATQAYEDMRQKILDTNQQIRDALLAAKDILKANVDAASAEIERLRALLDALNDAVSSELNEMVDEIVATNNAIMEAMKGASKLFTDSAQAASRAMAGETGDGGVAKSAAQAADAQNRLRDSSDGLKAAFDRLATRVDSLINSDSSRTSTGGAALRPADGSFFETLRRAGPGPIFAKATGV